jgi:threonyl-tRNA synthetase
MKSREEVVANISSSFLVLEPDGREMDIDISQSQQLNELASGFPELKQLIDFDVLGKKSGIVPPSIKLMREHELVDYESSSDSGHFRFYPQGTLILKLLEDWAEEIAVNRLQAMQIETPIIYNWEHPAIRAQAESFHERHYVVKVPYHPEKEFVLRFAGDFGLFCMLGDMKISYKNLPLRIYEFSKSYRYEKSGELVGLRRLRGFSMPDVHSFCADIGQSWQEYKELFRNYSDLASATGIEFAVAFRIVQEFYDKYRDEIISMLQYIGKPALIECLSSMKHYWAVKHEFQGLDSVGGVCQLSTVQLDVDDAERYNIVYTDQSGSKKGCVICHSSIGALERWLYLILESAQKMETPQFPLWIAPTQVRIIPISANFNEFCGNLAGKFKAKRVRADVDDRSESTRKKVREAEKRWIPYILVVGEQEVQSGKISVRKRGEKALTTQEPGLLIEEIKNQTKDMPFRDSSLPFLLSKRPIFFG